MEKAGLKFDKYFIMNKYTVGSKEAVKCALDKDDFQQPANS